MDGQRDYNFQKYPVSHRAALFEQQRIGWYHIFTGHLSQQWETLQENTAKNDKLIAKYQWAANIVTIILKQVINLWEMRNEEVHGATKSEQQNKLLVKQKEKIVEILELKPKCLARDHFLFPDDPKELLKETSTSRLATWLATRTKAIKESIRNAQLKDVQFTDTLHRWFQPSNYSKEKNRQQWFWDRLLHDPYNKKKKRKETAKTNEQGPKFFQQTLTKFFK